MVPTSARKSFRWIAQTRRPNIVIIIADDHGLEDSGCYGNTVVQTPNIDRLASEGMKFNRAFTATAMCAPSRSMLYTGLFPHRNGAHPNHSSIRAGVRTLPHYMSELGYQTALAGKTHIKPRASFPFEYVKLDGVDEYLAKVGGEPFCLVIATHDQRVMGYAKRVIRMLDGKIVADEQKEAA